jgi:site-specific DNA recombinase
MKRKAIIYIRVSTDEQADKGYSLKHQMERLEKFCEIHNIDIAVTFKEDYSAKTFNRPEFTKLLAMLKKNKNLADMLLFTKWDRFSRNAGDAYGMINQLNRLGVEPQAMEQPLDLNVPENKIMLAVYLAAPEVENDRRALNVLVGMRRARKEGRWMATAPKGYKNTVDENTKKIIAPSDDAIYIKFIFEEIAKGVHNLEQVWRMALEKGFECSKNNIWVLVRNPVYCGKITIPAYKEEPLMIVQGTHEPIISEALFYNVQDVLDGRKRNVPTKNTSKEELPLRGFLICKQCGSHLTGSASKGRLGGRYFYYHCKKGCNERFKASEANRLFLNELLKFECKVNVIEAYYKVMHDMFKLNGEDKSQAVKQINIEIQRNKERVQKAQQMMLDGDINASEFRDVKSQYQPEIDKLTRRAIEVASMDSNYKKYLDDGFCLLKHFASEYNRASLDIKQKLIGSVFPEKLIFDKNEYRTQNMMGVVHKICSKINAFGAKKSGTEDKKLSLSHRVTPAGLEPTTNGTGNRHSIH